MGGRVRKIIHIDMDCFYASVEMRENPALVGKPLAVGGKANQRGVLATCNYEARKFGLHSAMATAQAVKLCPNLILLPVNMPLYKQVSAQIHHIFRRYTEIIEPLSLDEAYLDVTDCEQCAGSATWIAQEIRTAIWQELHLTSSAGVAPLKFLAKIASEQNKPNGQFVITPEQVSAFIERLPLKKIPGVGKVTNEKLAQMGFSTCGDIQQSNPHFIYQHFGKLGQRLWDFCHGVDPCLVEANRLRKSIAVENTLLSDIADFEQAKAIVADHFEQLVRRLQKNEPNRPLASYQKLSIKLKFDDFSQTTLERTMSGVTLPAFFDLLAQIWPRRQNRKIRLIGLSVHIPAEKVIKQLNLWE
ncbi:DNA polymerase IV [Muribacter muris]|uniref:DNA polymerase IV n=1 Tax=Muribacter muris TaxID=67855 RepID=A0A4Y9K5K3_9PAST|nr:DNA polymerase IV [Muribacter muris]MBF0783997.1 DNA polymerase IV [Muribacter muris]MBF0827454.1 DNA polymerase IV [Muribacter muris]TFV13391.1 DNA polymerase IV [Muribacter muris]